MVESKGGSLAMSKRGGGNINDLQLRVSYVCKL